MPKDEKKELQIRLIRLKVKKANHRKIWKEDTPIGLVDILISTDKFIKILFISNTKSVSLDSKAVWDLFRDDVELQSPATVDFVHRILK